MPFKYPSLAERLLANSTILPYDDPDFTHLNGDPCWVWTGNRNGKGYGRLSVRNDRGRPTAIYAHRASLAAFKGIELRTEIIGLHLCNNPPCINPAHLESGTQYSNVAQAIRQGRHFQIWRR
jgi:hypothetical protein